MIKKHVLFLCAVGLLFSACSSDEPSEVAEPKEAKGGVVYGGSFDISQTDKYQSLYPTSILDLGSSNIANQIYEGLVKFNPKDMSVENALAENYVVSDSGTVYTFTLKKGVLFHDDACFEGGKGREVKASDVKYSFELMCKQTPDNVNFANTFKDKLLGANEYYEGTADNVAGIKVVDDYTIELTLTQPRASFLYILANPITSIMPKEAVAKYGNGARVGTGPFIFTDGGSADNELILVRNKNYHMVDSFGNQLPYLDTVHFHFENSKTQQLERFRNGSLDIINGLPSDKIKEVVQEQIADFSNVPPKFILGRSPEMITQYYEFNLSRPAFQDVRVRKAFNYAIDRQKIYRDVLVEEAFGPGKNGLVPPSFPGYDIEKVTGYSYDPEQARELMKQAGYPNGEGFGKITIELNSGGARNSRVAFEIREQLQRELNINLEVEVVTFAKKIEDAKYGRSDMFRSAWVADYPSPETFLFTCYGKNVPATMDEPSFPNTMRYVNPDFDALYEKGIATMDKEERYKYFMEAEQIMMNDAPIIVLWYSENYRLLRSQIRSFYQNPMNYLDCTGVYIKEREGKVKGAN